jgi:ferredoxin
MTPLTQTSFAPDSPYRKLARSLDALPNRFPPAPDESDLRLLAKIYTAEQAALAAELSPEKETPAQISQRLERDLREVSALLKEMSKNGLISFGKTPQGRLGFGLLPFVVGIYEEQVARMDAEMAELYETYYRQAFGNTLKVQPQVHRVIPVGQSVKNDMQIYPYESITDLIAQAQAWGVIDCICRKQRALIGKACGHPLDVCMVLSERTAAFDDSPTIHALTQAGALDTLARAEREGLVHCVSNSQSGFTYICNCCTCSCSILRGMAEMGIANVVARSNFINRVDGELCIGCGECLPLCSFNALTLDDVVQVSELKCVGCGLCVTACQQGALGLVRRTDESLPPADEAAWLAARRGNTVDLSK